MKLFKYIIPLAIIIAIVSGLFWLKHSIGHSVTIEKLLLENTELKKAITHLTKEDQIGYAKVVSQKDHEGQLLTTLKFVQTAPDNKLNTVFEKEYVIPGDIIHFDALIIKFQDKLVLDGKEKAIYIWRRVYGESMTPEDGFEIDIKNAEPGRYTFLMKEFENKEKEVFWTSMWTLANNPQKLSEHGIQAIFGNVVYSQVRPGLIYVFKISPTGQIYPEIIPDL